MVFTKSRRFEIDIIKYNEDILVRGTMDQENIVLESTIEGNISKLWRMLQKWYLHSKKLSLFDE